MKRVPLSARDGKPRAYALVDDDDWMEHVGAYSWSLKISRTGGWYAIRCRRDDLFYMHRVLLGLGPYAEDPREADHIDGNGLNNQRANLRVVTAGENRQNLVTRGGTSRFRNVYAAPDGRWIAKAGLNRRHYYLGYFATEIDAAIAAQAWRDEHMPFAQPDPALVAALDLGAAA